MGSDKDLPLLRINANCELIPASMSKRRSWLVSSTWLNLSWLYISRAKDA